MRTIRRRTSVSYMWPSHAPKYKQPIKPELSGRQYPLVVLTEGKWKKYYFPTYRHREVMIKYTSDPFKRLPIEEFDQPTAA